MQMKLAIHKSDLKGYFSNRWIDYCENNSISYKIVNCYSNDIIQQLYDCEGLLWHFSHANPVDCQIAIKLIATLEAAGKKTFPDLNSCWHFDDKVAQKYLLEAINAPIVKSYVFYSKKEAFKWADKTEFPKVFKLKGGSGSANVQLVHTKHEARQLVKKAFGRGFRQFDRLTLFKYAIKKHNLGKSSLKDVFLSFLKIFVKSEYEKVKGKEIGYAYFQEFMPNNDSDIRIIVIGDKAFGIKRMVRTDDFRASGSGQILYAKELIDENCVRIAFETSDKLKANCLAYDFIYDKDKIPLIVEISYGFVQEGYDACPGYWDRDLNWHEGEFIPQYWMIENIVESINLPHKND